MKIDNWRLFQFFKYAVYLLLTTNVYLFFVDEYAAASVEFPDGITLFQWIGAYASTIDTANWVVLLLLFELETCILDDRHFTPTVTVSLRIMRALCYALIVYSLWGYIANVVFLADTAILSGLSNLCALPTGEWSFATTLDEYELVTAANCSTLSEASQFLRLGDLAIVADQAGLTDIRLLAWVDVINASVWILVVIALEIDVFLQERGQFEGRILKTSNAAKFLLYAILFLAAVYWGLKGDFVDFWDAFLWLVAFFFIEMNVIEWRQEIREEQALPAA
ncbi:MAG: hypothetical protein QNJ07_12085 [Woeseiaceae bacterium]|nr:hypothetical protein [Woeseiaceae bacterium]